MGRGYDQRHHPAPSGLLRSARAGGSWQAHSVPPRSGWSTHCARARPGRLQEAPDASPRFVYNRRTVPARARLRNEQGPTPDLTPNFWVPEGGGLWPKPTLPRLWSPPPSEFTDSYPPMGEALESLTPEEDRSPRGFFKTAGAGSVSTGPFVGRATERQRPQTGWPVIQR